MKDREVCECVRACACMCVCIYVFMYGSERWVSVRACVRVCAERLIIGNNRLIDWWHWRIADPIWRWRCTFRARQRTSGGSIWSTESVQIIDMRISLYASSSPFFTRTRTPIDATKVCDDGSVEIAENALVRATIVPCACVCWWASINNTYS